MAITVLYTVPTMIASRVSNEDVTIQSSLSKAVSYYDEEWQDHGIYYVVI